MQFDRQIGGYVLECSGRRLDANRGIIGINHELQTYEGYDGRFGPDEATIEHGMDEPFTRAERMEIALFVSSLWMQWAIGRQEDRPEELVVGECPILKGYFEARREGEIQGQRFLQDVHHRFIAGTLTAEDLGDYSGERFLKRLYKLINWKL